MLNLNTIVMVIIAHVELFYPNTTNSSGQMFEIMDNMQKIIDCEDIVESFINHLKNLDEEYFEA